MGIIHEFFYDNKWLGILMVLAGLTYSGFLYFRAYEQWIGAKRQDSGRRLRHHLRQHTPASAEGSTPIQTPGPAGEGQQEDLLSRLAREEEEDAAARTAAEPGRLPKEVGTERGTRSEHKPDPAYRSTHILKAFDGLDDDGGTIVDASAAGRTPLQNAIRAAVEESLREDGPDQDQTPTPVETASPGDDEDDRDPLITGEPSPLASPTQPAQPAQRKRSSATHEEAQRRAQRHEEIGLHREVHADQLAADQGVRRISDDDRKRRLSQLGIAFDADTFETEAQRKARLGTDELDDILGRLDAALAGPAPTPAPTAEASAPSAEAPADVAGQAPDGTAAEAPHQDEEAADLVLGEDGTTTTGAPDETAGDTDAEPAEETVADRDDDAVADPTESHHDDDGAIPDWARADTFDEDEPRSGGGTEQQKLF